MGAIAEVIATGQRAVANAENRKPSTGIAIDAALPRALGLLDQLDPVAAPERDKEGQIMALSSERGRARSKADRSHKF
jgi:hypothetical protein